MRKIRVLACVFLILSLSVILMGCGNVKVSSDVKININGSSETTLKVYYDDTISKLINNDLISNIIGDSNSNLSNSFKWGEIRKYKEDNLNVEEVTLIGDKVKISELNNLSNEYVDININNKKGFITNIYEVTITPKEDISNILSSYINDNVNKYVSINLSSFLSSNIASVLSEIPYDLSITMPVKIANSNADEVLNDKTMKYSFTLSDLNESNSIVFSVKAPNIMNITIISVIFLLIIIFIIIKIKRKSK